MKRRLISILCSLALLVNLAGPAVAEESKALDLPIYKDHVFYSIKTGDVSYLEPVPSGTLNSTYHYVIQSSVNGKAVTALKSDILFKFEGQTSTERQKPEISLSIPDSVTTIPKNLDLTPAKKVTFVCNDNSPAAAYAKEHSIEQITPQQNQQRIDSRTYSNKTLTVYCNNSSLQWEQMLAPLPLPVVPIVPQGEKNYYTAADKKTTVTLTDYGQAGRTVSLDKSGSAKIYASDAAEIEVKREGYVTQTLKFKDLAAETSIYLEAATGDVYIKSVKYSHTDEKGVTTIYDAYHQDCLIDRTSSKPTQLEAAVDWGSHGAGTVKLWQDGSQAAFGSDGKLSFVLKEKFDTAETIYVVATAADGTEVKKELKIKPSDIALDGTNLSIGSFTLTMPDGLPIIGGYEMDVDMWDFPIDVTIENGKVYAIIGFLEVANEHATKNHGNGKVTHSATAKDDRVKTLFSDLKDGLKDAKKGVSDAKEEWKRMKNLFDALKDKRFRPKKTSKKSISGDFELMGYFEGVIHPDGKLSWLDGQIVAQASGSIDWGGQYSAGPVPMYWAVSLSSNLEGRLSPQKVVLIIADKDSNPFTPVGTIGFDIGVGGDTGPGVNGVLGAGIGIEGKAKVDVKFKKELMHYALGGGLSVYARAFLAFLEWKKSWDVAQGTWKEGDWRYGGTARLADGSTASTFVFERDLKGMNDPSAYQVQDQSYLDKPSEFLGNSAQLFDAGTSITDFQSNVYTMPQAQLVRLSDGGELMVWLGGADNRVSPNKTAVFYSYKPNGGSWSTPAQVENDETADFQPVAAAAGNTAWLVWQSANKAFSEAELTDNWDTAGVETAKSLEIHAARFNNGTLSTPISVTANAVYDHSPSVALSADGSSGKIYWLQSSANILTGNDTGTVIMQADLNGTQCGSPSTAYTPGHPVKGLAAGYTNSAFQWAAVLDTDDNNATVSDTELYVNGTRITENQVVDSAPVYSNGTLYWYQDGTIRTQDASILPEDIHLGSDQYQVLTDENGRSAIVYSSSVGAKSEVYGIFRDPTVGTVSQPTALTGLGAHTEAGTGYYSAAKGLVLPCEVTAVTGEITGGEEGTVNGSLPFGQTDLRLMTYGEESHLSIEDVYFDAARLVADNNFSVFVRVKNSGVLPAEHYDVVMWDTPGKMPVSSDGKKNNKVADYRASQPLAGGETTEIELSFKLPESFEGIYDITLSPSTGDPNAYNESTIRSSAVATEQVTFSSKDLIARAEAIWTGDGTPVVKGTVKNAGSESFTGLPVSLYAIDDAGNETKVMEQTTDVGANEQSVVAFSLAQVDAAYYEVRIAEQSGEINTANNVDFCVFLEKPATLLAVKDFAKNGNMVSATIAVSMPEGVTASSAMLLAAAYDSNGKMIAVAKKELSANVTEYPLSLSGSGMKEIKYFLLNADSLSPLCGTVTRIVP